MYVWNTAISVQKWGEENRQIDVFYHIYIKYLWKEMEQTGTIGYF